MPVFKTGTLNHSDTHPDNKILVQYVTEYNKNIDNKYKIDKLEDFDELIKQIYWFLKYKILSQKFLICVKGSDLVYLNGEINF